MPGCFSRQSWCTFIVIAGGYQKAKAAEADGDAAAMAANVDPSGTEQ